ncbi:MAG TPA: hypothetical protein PKH79_01585 [Prolixibacteraceae bacterium]|nr:hypothetical protein [Prolixibacteraceae bacterium]
MQKVHILIVVESPDLAKSLGNLIMDVFGVKAAMVEYAYNIQDGLIMANQTEFHFIFLKTNFESERTANTKILFKNASLNPLVEIIVLTYSSNFNIQEQSQEVEKNLRLPMKEEIDVDELAYIFEKMK